MFRKNKIAYRNRVETPFDGYGSGVMKYYCCTYPSEDNTPIYEVLSEQEIIDQYFYQWALNMYAAGKQDQVSLDGCIMNYIVVHWAWEL